MWRKRKEIRPESERMIKDADRSRERTMNRAMRLLAAKPRSVAELRERLLEKSWTSSAIVDVVIERLKEYKYLDDQQFATDLAMSKLRQKAQGKRRLQQTLSQKKLEKTIVEEALKAAFERLPEDELIDSVIALRLRLKGPPKTRQETKKFLDHLLRRGFSYELIRQKMPKMTKDEPM